MKTTPPEAFLVGGIGWITRDGHKIRMRIVQRDDGPDGALRMVMETDAGERYTLMRDKRAADVTRVTRSGTDLKRAAMICEACHGTGGYSCGDCSGRVGQPCRCSPTGLSYCPACAGSGIAHCCEGPTGGPTDIGNTGEAAG